MSSYSQHQNPNEARILISLLCLLALLWMTSCDLSKKVIKSNTATANDKEVITHNTTTKFDFGTVDKDEYSLNYEPFDYSQIMWVITPKGDTVQSQNAKVTATKTNTRTQNNKTENETGNSNYKASDSSSATAKEKEETGQFNSEIILYVVGGIVILGMFALFLMYKSINKNTAVLNAVLQKI